MRPTVLQVFQVLWRVDNDTGAHLPLAVFFQCLLTCRNQFSKYQTYCVLYVIRIAAELQILILRNVINTCNIQRRV